MSKRRLSPFYTSSKGDKKSVSFSTLRALRTTTVVLIWGTFDHARRLTAPFVLPPRPPPRELQRMAAREAAAAKASEWLNAARLETMDMLRQLQREVAGTVGAEEAEQREVTVRLSE